MRLWTRAVIARRMYKRILAKQEELKATYEARIHSIKVKYEKELEIERTRHRLLHTEWAGRFLQQMGRAPLMSSSSAEDYVESKYDNDETPDPLTPQQQLLLQDSKDQFVENGRAEGRTDDEIENFWRQMLPKIESDVRNLIN